MGNYITALSERVSLIATPRTWIEGAAIEQLKTTSKLDGIEYAVGMPDLHPGSGYPIGAVFFTTHTIYPTLVGNDIGCGIGLWQTDLEIKKFKSDKAEKQLSSIDAPLTDEERHTLLEGTSAPGAPGTIGGGNHFAELQKIDTVYDEKLAAALMLDTKRLQLLVHSGSRHMGEKIMRAHTDRFHHSGLTVDSDACHAYLQQHNAALMYAEQNRELIARRMIGRLHSHVQHRVSDIFHNALTPGQAYGQAGWFHRKGATPSNGGAVVIPGSRGDYSYVVAPFSDEASEQALYSLAHGAGRKWMRMDCKGRLSRFSTEQLRRTSFGSRLICDNHETVYEEAPQAYKPIDNIIEALEGAGLIRRIARLQPVLTYKARRNDV